MNATTTARVRFEACGRETRAAWPMSPLARLALARRRGGVGARRATGSVLLIERRSEISVEAHWPGSRSVSKGNE